MDTVPEVSPPDKLTGQEVRECVRGQLARWTEADQAAARARSHLDPDIITILRSNKPPTLALGGSLPPGVEEEYHRLRAAGFRASVPGFGEPTGTATPPTRPGPQAHNAGITPGHARPRSDDRRPVRRGAMRRALARRDRRAAQLEAENAQLRETVARQQTDLWDLAKAVASVERRKGAAV